MRGRSHDACRQFTAARRIPFAQLAIAMLVVSGLPSTAAGQVSADSAALLKYIEEYQRTWNTRDPALVAAFFTEDADLVMGNQPPAQGRKAIEDWWRAYFGMQEQGRRGRFDATSVKLLGSGAALVDVTSTTGGSGPADETLVTRKARGTWLLRRQGDGWLIAAMRGLPTEEDQVELIPSREAAEDLRPQIRAFVAAYEDAFNRHDADALSAFYRNDADIVVRELPVVRGMQAIRDWWSRYFSQPRPYYALMVIDQIRMITDDVALVNVVGTGAPIEHTDQVEPVRTARATWILARANGEWRIAALRVLPSEPDRVIRNSSREGESDS